MLPYYFYIKSILILSDFKKYKYFMKYIFIL